jgi:hypothetical protein
MYQNPTYACFSSLLFSAVLIYPFFKILIRFAFLSFPYFLALLSFILVTNPLPSSQDQYSDFDSASRPSTSAYQTHEGETHEQEDTAWRAGWPRPTQDLAAALWVAWAFEGEGASLSPSILFLFLPHYIPISAPSLCWGRSASGASCLES